VANLLPSIPPPQSFLYRVTRRRYNPFEPPPWEYAHEDGTFGGRFDDPGKSQGIAQQNRFRILYCATEGTGAFGETLAGLRPKLDLIAALERGEHGAPLDIDLTVSGFLDEWRAERWISRIQLDPSFRFADLENPETLAVLRSSPHIARIALESGLNDVDRSALYSPRRFVTQTIARFVYEKIDDAGKPLFAGLRYMSRLNAEWECWAVFDERLRAIASYTEDIKPDDAGMLAALASLNLG
jgi:hypothetical protein